MSATTTRAARMLWQQRAASKMQHQLWARPAPARTALAAATAAPTARRGFRTSAGPLAKEMNPNPKDNPGEQLKPPSDTDFGRRRFADLDLKGKVFIVTGGAQGLGLCLAEGLVEAGGKVYCFDRSPEPDEEWTEAQKRVMAPEGGGSLEYRQQDVTDAAGMEATTAAIADAHGGIDGAVAAAGVQQVTAALDYGAADAQRMLAVNYTGALTTAQCAARAMMRHRVRGGSICLVASMSGLVANKGLLSCVYNSSKAAVIQLARNLAMEWTPVRDDGSGGIRVNCISPGHILTPMVMKNFDEVPGLRETWEAENMMGRLAEPDEFKGAVLFLLSNASSFVTASNLVIDGGHTAW